MNLRDLEYIIALAELRHFGKAAARCYVSQPTLSGQIKKLEAELGVQLFERNQHHVYLTAIGETVVAKARFIMQEATSIYESAQAARDPYQGRVHAALIPTLGPYLLPHLLPIWHQRFPKLEWFLYEYQTTVIVEKVQNGQLDLAILALPLDIQGLQEQPLFEEPFVLGVGEHKLVSLQNRPVTMAQLSQENVLLLDDGHCLRTQALSVCQQVGARESDSFRATSLETLKAMVGLGNGVTLLPELAIQPPLAAGLHILTFQAPVPSRTIGLLYRASAVRHTLFTEIGQCVKTWWEQRKFVPGNRC